MKTELSLNLRAFHVLIRDERTGEDMEDLIVFEKQQLKTAEDMGLTPDDLIYHHFNARGFRVLDIYKAAKRTISMNLMELYKAHCFNELGKREVRG